MVKIGVYTAIIKGLLNKRKADYSAFKVSMNIKKSKAIISHFRCLCELFIFYLLL